MARPIFLRCNQVHALLSRSCDSKLRLDERLLLRLHLLGCDACSLVGRQFTFLGRALRQLGR